MKERCLLKALPLRSRLACPASEPRPRQSTSYDYESYISSDGTISIVVNEPAVRDVVYKSLSVVLLYVRVCVFNFACGSRGSCTEKLGFAINCIIESF